MNEKIYEKAETAGKEGDFAFQDAEEIVREGVNSVMLEGEENEPDPEAVMSATENEGMVSLSELNENILTDEEPYPKKVLPKWLYDLLCFIARFLLPACGAAYGALAAIWNLPYGEAIVSTVSVLIVFLSTVLAIDAKTFFSTRWSDGTKL